jgi:hypothetical protein
MTECPRFGYEALREPCQHCGATESELCPLADMTPGLLTGAPVTAGTAAICNPDDGVCEACQ